MVSGVYEPEPEDENDSAKEDDGNTNNNANSQLGDAERDDESQNKPSRRSKKYKMPPTPPTGQLVIVIYGKNGKTDELPLSSDEPLMPEMFRPGERVDLKVNTYYVTQILTVKYDLLTVVCSGIVHFNIVHFKILQSQHHICLHCNCFL